MTSMLLGNQPTIQIAHFSLIQVAVDRDGRPLIERMGWEEDQGKEWQTKTESDGEEGPEEDYGWEEQ